MTDDRYSGPILTHEREASASARFVLRWIPAIIMAYAFLISPFLMQWGNSGGDVDINVAASQSNVLNQLFWIGVFGAAIGSAWHNLKDIGRLLTNPVTLLLLLYLAFAALSVFWSPVPGIAFRRLVLQAIVVLALGISTVLADDRDETLDRILFVIAVTVLVNFADVLLTPPGPIGHEGIYSQKNGLGAAMAFSVLFCIYGAAAKRGRLRVVFLGLTVAAFYALVESKSKTSLGLAVLLPILIYVAILITRPFRMNVALFLLFCLALGLAGWFYVSAMTRFGFEELSMLLFGDETFTGRTVIWSFVVDVISRNPLFGQGYSSFWGIGAGSIVEREAPGFVVGLLQSHNGYLDVLVETGLIGLSILIALILAALFSAARAIALRPALCWLSMTLVVTVVCHNMLESSWFRGYSLTWMLFVLAALLPQASGKRRVR
ncbi:O-antigen ligase [Breoghania corrubedonensis]|uniref:O-antigen ligase n=1 Tax=Breoghania corrubedonensis TaxID=665038 RepID=A0A2T5VG56_9HYPH|nr:O-antigen ligase family protein [Breoghania corrubedonensis]PTW62735.1 O-antigen ligase [Breoghania corrubedonensis]